jgi:hypothetical protein
MNIRRIAITGAAALALVAGGTAAGAVTITNANTVYKGCIEGTSRTMEHVYTQANPPACPSGSFRATWGGPPTAGPNGLDLTTVQSSVTGGLIWDAPCPSSEPYIVSGGYSITSGTGVITQSFPNAIAGTNNWTVTAAGPTDYTVYAICSK